MVSLDPAFKTPAGTNFGIHAVVVDPNDTTHVYVGTSAQGIFKSTDCGATWTLISTGTAANLVNGGRQGTMVVDPVDSKILYADARYGAGGGVFKSIDGGVNWVQTLSPALLKAFINGAQVEWVAMDPTDHLHLTAIPHFFCDTAQGFDKDCMLETFDGGTTWTVLSGTPVAEELGGQIMLDKKTWLWTQGGLWRTADGGATWSHVYKGQAFPYLYRAPDGTLYVPGGNEGVLKSTDGINWSAVPKTTLSGSLAVTMTAMYTSGGLNANVYNSAKLPALTAWSALPSPAAQESIGGWMMAGDPDHGLVYSACFRGGLWRYTE